MNVEILEIKTDKLVAAQIRSGAQNEMPSIHDNWRFNFNRHINKPNRTAYVLVKEESPKKIEGCLIFEMKNKETAYIAFVEVAPHNKGNKKQYDYVAGCLIAFAFKQSLIKCKGDNKGMLFFDVKEESSSDQKKLMAHYQKKFYAKSLSATRMLIIDEAGERLIEEYLKE